MKFTTRDIVLIALVAALYVVLTALPPFNAIAYGPIQFRIAEILNFLVFYNRRYVIAVTLGVIISNLFTSNNIVIDVIFGSLQTLITLLIAVYVFDKLFKHMLTKFLTWSVFNSIFGMAIVTWDILFFAHPTPAVFFSVWWTVALGEFVVLFIGSFIMDGLGRRIDLTK